MTDDKLDRVFEAIDSLARSVESLQERVTRLEQWSGAHPDGAPQSGSAGREAPFDAPPSPTPASFGVPLVRVFSVLGTAFLALAGAFLLRSFTEAGALSPMTGVVIGIAYALGWLFVAERAGGRGAMLIASVLGVTAVLVAYPLLWEATTKLDALSPALASTLVSAMTGLTMLIAWWRRVRALAWAATLATICICAALLWSTTAMEVFTLPVLLLGAITIWLGYTREWGPMRWLTAAAADLMLLPMLFLLVRTTNTPGRFDHLSLPLFISLSVGLLVLYLGSFAVQILGRRGKAGAFEAVQTAAVLLVGFGGTVLVLGEGESESLLLGVLTLLAATGCYVAAFAFLDRRQGRGTNFYYFAWLGAVLLLLGSPLLIPAPGMPALWLFVGLVAAFLGGRHDRITLRAQCAVLAVAGAWSSGIVRGGVEGFVAPTMPEWSGGRWLALLLVLSCYVVLAATHGRREARWMERLPRLVVLLLGVLGLGGALVALAVGLFASPTPAVVAVLRTVALSGAAILLAALGRRRNLIEMSWLPYPLLVAGGIKLFLEDLHQGEPVAIFIAFGCFGIALITAPRLQRKAGTQSETPPSAAA